MPTPITTVTARPLPGDPAERLQARCTAARLAAEDLEVQEEAAREQQETMEVRTGRAWTVVHAYEHTLHLVQTNDCDNDATMAAADRQRMLRLLADVDWQAHNRRRFDDDATAALSVHDTGARLRYDGRLLHMQIGCPADPDAAHTITIRSRIQLAWALDHLDQPDLPQWVCQIGCAPTTPAGSHAAPDTAGTGADQARIAGRS
jgi:hypothetical protein